MPVDRLAMRQLYAPWALLLLVFSPDHVLATTWSAGRVQDPIGSGECAVHRPMSSGSYIYHWPSKYDGVYWPYTDPHWIWFCPGSGYTSFGDDFHKLTQEEIENVRRYLQSNFRSTNTDVPIALKLKLLEDIYALRNKDSTFWAHFYRVLAYSNEKTPQVSLEYRRKALPLIEKRLQDLKPGFEMIQHLYLMGEYNRQLGVPQKAREYFARAKTVQWTDKEGKVQIGSEYINALIRDREKLMTGGEAR